MALPRERGVAWDRPEGWWKHHGRAVGAVFLLCVLGAVIAGIALVAGGPPLSVPVAAVPATGDSPTSAAATATGDAPTSAAATATGDVSSAAAEITTIETSPPAPTTTQTTVSTTPTALVAARLVKVVDGDTIVVKLASGNQERVALIGIDAPEKGKKGSKPPAAYLKQLLSAGPIGLELGTDTRDKYKRLLAYVYVGSLFVNREMVAKGLAKAAPSGANRKYDQVLAEAQASAQTTSKGPGATTTTGRQQ
jgi:micrococcal nuclease